jgi:osmotically inducible protein OsmC
MAFGGFEGQYSFGSRFEEGPGTNPEELLGAAQAGCFSMFLAGALGKAGHSPERVATNARVHIDKVDDGFKITRVELDSDATVPGIADDEFQSIAEESKRNCPVSQALTGVAMSLNAKLSG